MWSRRSIRGSAYFDLARAVSFDPTVLNLVAIRPYIRDPMPLNRVLHTLVYNIFTSKFKKLQIKRGDIGIA